jgi:hypothetical protein
MRRWTAMACLGVSDHGCGARGMFMIARLAGLDLVVDYFY